MQNLPPSEVYDQEFEYMPWGKLIDAVITLLVRRVPRNGTLLDLMCGPGYLVNKLLKQRPDIKCVAVDLDVAFLVHAEKRCPQADFKVGDARSWNSPDKFDAVICTAGVHHLPDADQEPFIQKIKDHLKEGGFALIADPYIDDYRTPQERKLAAAKLGYEYLRATIEKKAPKEVEDAAVQVLQNDIQLVEWKTSVIKRIRQLKKHFGAIHVTKTWPNDRSTLRDYGDYFFFLYN